MTRQQFGAAFLAAIDKQEMLVAHTPGWKPLIDLVWEELEARAQPVTEALRLAKLAKDRADDAGQLARALLASSYTAPEAALKRDAERYHFLKARRGNIVEIAWNSFYSDIYATAKMGNVDAAIDKAMADKPSPQHGEQSKEKS